MAWKRRKVSNLGRVTLDQNYTSGSGAMELTTGDSSYIPATGIFWLAWSEDESDPDAAIHLFRVTSVSGDDVSVTAETSEGAGDTNIAAGQVLRVVTTIGAVEMLGMVLLEEQTASNSTSLDFTSSISSTYNKYMISIENLVAASNADLLLRFSTNGGSSYDAGNNYNWARCFFHSGGVGGDGSNATTAIALALGGGTTSSWSYNGTVYVYNPLGALYKLTDCRVVHPSSGNALLAHVGSGVYLSATAVDALRIIMSTGNISSGTVRVYGMSK